MEFDHEFLALEVGWGAEPGADRADSLLENLIA